MKKLLFTTSIIALLFAGCSKDDDGGGDDDCQTCESYDFGGFDFPEQEVCEGENGNAFIDGDDTGISFNDYITAQESFTDCN